MGKGDGLGYSVNPDRAESIRGGTRDMYNFEKFKQKGDVRVSPEIAEEIRIACEKYFLKIEIVMAIAKTESDFNPFAQRFEAAYPYLYTVRELADLVGCTKDTMTAAQRTSYGLMQPMGALCYELGFRGWPSKLFNVRVNLDYSCKHIRALMDKGFVNEDELYAAYNAGSARRVDNGVFVNQSNVNRFMFNLDRIRKSLKLEEEVRLNRLKQEMDLSLSSSRSDEEK